MFINNGAMVNVVAGRLAGRFGKVNKIVIVSGTPHVLVFVELFDPDTGDFPIHMFEPAELERRRYSEGELLHFMQMQADAERAPLKEAA